MKPFILFLLTAVTLLAQEQVKLQWDWNPDPAAMGGLSTNDYATNFVFAIYCSTNVAQPFNQWLLLTTTPATNRSLSLTLSNTNSLFFAARTEGVRDVSPFSNVCPWMRAAATGVLRVSKQ